MDRAERRERERKRVFAIRFVSLCCNSTGDYYFHVLRCGRGGVGDKLSCVVGLSLIVDCEKFTYSYAN